MRLTSKQRKIVYLLVILVLLAPILYLGMPSGGKNNSMEGVLAKLRNKYHLGETNFGKVPPASATMNLLLLGLRGVACNVLWQQANEQKMKKEWNGMMMTTESITLLQPHYRQVWEFQGWNLAYNVSAEWDGVTDRYRWVKQGAKYMMRGTKVNNFIPDLYYETARIVGQKIGHSDEWKTFRKLYFHDPDDESYNQNFPPDSPENASVKPDAELNPENKDNYLTSHDWYKNAVDIVKGGKGYQHREDIALYYSRPHLAFIQCADAYNRDGRFDDGTRLAWEIAHEKWNIDYGRNERIMTRFGHVILDYKGSNILQEITKEENDAFTLAEKEKEANNKVKLANFNEWKERTKLEKQEAMRAAHFELAEGKKIFTEFPSKALGHTQKGLEKMVEALKEFPTTIEFNRSLNEETLKGIIVYIHLHDLLGKPLPKNFPLSDLPGKFPSEYSQYEMQFQKSFGGN